VSSRNALPNDPLHRTPLADGCRARPGIVHLCYTPSVLHDVWTVVTAVVSLAVSLVASGHAVMRKRDVRAALGWVAFIWLAPVVGALVCALLGVNRIRRRAHALHLPEVRPRPAERSPARPAELPAPADHLATLVHLGDAVVRPRLVAGKDVPWQVLGRGYEDLLLMEPGWRAAQASPGEM
jgi:hypothetical protein